MSILQQWSVVVPVKRPELAKTRLADAVGEHREQLARAFAADTIEAAYECSLVSAVVVVTDDAAMAAEAAALGARVVSDAPGAGLNAALRHGAAAIRADDPNAAVASLSADLPTLRPMELSAVLTAAAEHQVAFVADAAGIGTTVYTSAPRAPFDPQFGERSRAAHRAAGAVELDLAGIASIRRDIDTPVDLWDAIRLGVGPRTGQLITQLDKPA